MGVGWGGVGWWWWGCEGEGRVLELVSHDSNLVLMQLKITNVFSPHRKLHLISENYNEDS